MVQQVGVKHYICNTVTQRMYNIKLSKVVCAAFVRLEIRVFTFVIFLSFVVYWHFDLKYLCSKTIVDDKQLYLQHTHAEHLPVHVQFFINPPRRI